MTVRPWSDRPKLGVDLTKPSLSLHFFRRLIILNDSNGCRPSSLLPPVSLSFFLFLSPSLSVCISLSLICLHRYIKRERETERDREREKEGESERERERKKSVPYAIFFYLRFLLCNENMGKQGRVLSLSTPVPARNACCLENLTPVFPLLSFPWQK